VTPEDFATGGKLIRRFSNADTFGPIDEKELNVPTYWVRPPQTLSADKGMHRFVWDLHYPEPDALQHEYPISAIYMDTPRLPLGPTALPGTYIVKLTVNGKTITQPLTVKMDPRVKAPLTGLMQQFTLATRVADMLRKDYDAIERLRRRRESTPDNRPSEIERDLIALNDDLTTVYGVVEEVDAAPTAAVVKAATELQQRLTKLLAQIQ